MDQFLIDKTKKKTNLLDNHQVVAGWQETHREPGAYVHPVVFYRRMGGQQESD